MELKEYIKRRIKQRHRIFENEIFVPLSIILEWIKDYKNIQRDRLNEETIDCTTCKHTKLDFEEMPCKACIKYSMYEK